MGEEEGIGNGGFRIPFHWNEIWNLRFQIPIQWYPELIIFHLIFIEFFKSLIKFLK